MGSTSFHYSFAFLPKKERQAIAIIYAFCRRIDDIVDQENSNDDSNSISKLERLTWWRNIIERIYASNNDAGFSLPEGSIARDLFDVVHTYTIPKQYLLTVIDGCQRDLQQKRYSTFEDLKEYCYGVASIVGLISIEIFGYKYEQTQQYAINLGYALQLTNIIRDVKEDLERGYMYIPLEDLRRFKYTEADMTNHVYDDRFISLMEFQAKRAREFYHKARTSLLPDERVTMVAAEIMDAIYYRLLEKIQLNDFDVFGKRISVNSLHKIITAMRIWIGSKLFVERLRGR